MSDTISYTSLSQIPGTEDSRIICGFKYKPDYSRETTVYYWSDGRTDEIRASVTDASIPRNKPEVDWKVLKNTPDKNIEILPTKTEFISRETQAELLWRVKAHVQKQARN
jgi:hypothetical protein